ncbi:MAG: hypothetical protein IJT21_02375 [Synergistaceae bacterium]|nr:hypothetical protein [Synergistaceae bacterium]
MKKFIVMILLITAIKAQALPVKHDSRVLPVKSQKVLETCYSFAAMGACEANFMTHNPDSNINLPGDFLISYAEELFTFPALELGDEFTAAAILSRLPEFCGLRLRDVYFMSRHMPFDKDFISDETRKNLILANGAIYAGIFVDHRLFERRGKIVTYFNNSQERRINHDILITGWDDNFPLFYFNPRPSKNGAWLVKDSWKPENSENGYYWIPYEQNIKGGAAFITEKFNPDARIYLHDDLGYCSSIKFSWAANIFRVREDLEYLNEAAFYTPRNNMSWDIYIYECGKNFPDSPVSGILKSHISGKFDLAGYHTVEIPEKFSLWQGTYLSVILKLGAKIMPVETQIINYSDNAVINANESYFSLDGQKWTDGKNLNSNACIKIFTVIRE